jgi:hypothetical protein
MSWIKSIAKRLLVVIAVLAGYRAFPEPIVQYHCAGGTQLSGNIKLAALNKVLGLQSTVSMENMALAKFAKLLTNDFSLATGTSSCALIEPLLKDIAEQESMGSFATISSNGLSFFLVLHLEASRIQLWKETFGKLFPANPKAVSRNGFSGQAWAAGASSLWMFSARDWLLVGCGDGFSNAQSDCLTQIASQGRPAPTLEENHWLEADLLSTNLGGWFRFLKPAKIHIDASPDQNNFKIEAQIHWNETIPWAPKAWRVPKELIHGQIISFTAGQDVAAFLNMNRGLSNLSGNPLTNQFCCWALDQMPLLSYMAWPEADASNTLERLSTEAPAALNSLLKRFNGAELAWHADARKLVLQNIRLFGPALQVVQTNNSQFLFLSTFPMASVPPPISDALLNQVQGRTNLVYYDWERTGRRVGGLQILNPMIANRSMGTNSESVSDLAVENQWIGSLAGLDGNTVTEITRYVPSELLVKRTAPLGFTAVELVLLADWISGGYTGPIHSSTPSASSSPLPFPR